MKLVGYFLFFIIIGFVLPVFSSVKLIYSDRSAFQVQNQIFFLSDLEQTNNVLRGLKCLMPQSLLLTSTNFDKQPSNLNLDSVIKIKKLIYWSLLETPYNKMINVDEQKLQKCRIDFSKHERQELRELYIYEINLQKKFGTMDVHNRKRNALILGKLGLYLETVEKKISHYVFLQN
ncbi:MAG: hypothetical protein A2381_12580 [Bdellovibrionales bacterium RIFOXYB1_FULL_37_110]|nr:MAG: hypothetical protein A2181_07305 [Bdellovibrionales bacterium RIFOXYA1_FULL_38_20]OFZ51519.1 MAG: hypothetical protein A2417_12265 [Bdellovibrionales bacterium RIFOXYC1_FULL_37_79]OFZ60353.1 MAG: hypothetical protein A2381_12580 [Bdellovibrionales bacterium RIFOXYB1_FULL_37_110]OFZ62091.1 MAG: hypothetical protein A2328_08170 [Bdellovibrionales bacterium RIFOXYB2_FULL_36_6]OFZ63843.1 MAG: hypothetical protein A2577_05495 [Bdellovibrionales bacterium RIFOXYD1_FULL_36_51]